MTEDIDNDEAIARLLRDGVVMLCDGDVRFYGQGEQQETTVLMVNTSDVFAWGCADSEPLPTSEIQRLYQMHLASKWGSTKWACLRANMRPQLPLVKQMKDAGAWDAELEALPSPPPS